MSWGANQQRTPLLCRSAEGQSTIINLDNCEESSAHPAEANDGPPSWYTPIERALAQPDWWLVIIAFLTGCAIAYQAREMASATDEMKKSTNAAMLSAKTLVASERPLLVVSPQPVKDEPHTFVLRVVNEGKGPAQLCGGGAGSGQQAVDFSPADSDFRGFIPNPLKSLFVNEDGFVVGGKIVGQDMTISGKITKMFQ